MRLKRTHKGSKYQSTGELEIAKFLEEMKIEFEYEFPIAVVDSEKTKIWYPDFYLKEYQIVIEYFGMYNHNDFYRENADHKKDVYKNCGIQFLPIYKLNKNWKEYVLKTILLHLQYKKDKMQKNLEKLKKEEKNGGFGNLLKKIFSREKNQGEKVEQTKSSTPLRPERRQTKR